MSESIDAFLSTTFATRAAAEAALSKANGQAVKARKALGSKKSTPIDADLGENVLAFAAATRARGATPTRNGGCIQLMALEVPRDLSALLYLGAHWLPDQVALGGASLYGAGMISYDKTLVGGAPWGCQVGTTHDGAVIGCRVTQPAAWVIMAQTGGEQTFPSLEQLIAHLRADARARGQETDLDAPPPAKKARATKSKTPLGPPVPTAGDDHRVYVGATEIQVSLPSVDLYHQKRVVVSMTVKQKLPPDDLWLVSREGALYRLTPLGPVRRGSVACSVAPIDAT